MPSSETVTTVTTETQTSEQIATLDNTSSNVENVSFNASNHVQMAEELVAEAASDEKKADARAYVAKYAADRAKWAKKISEHKLDHAYHRAENAHRKADHMERLAREANEHEEHQEWRLNHSKTENKTKSAVAIAAEQLEYHKAHEYREDYDKESIAKMKYDAAVAHAKRQLIIDESIENKINAQAHAEDAARSRVMSDHQDMVADAAHHSYENATDFLKDAYHDEHLANHDVWHAEHHAAHDANEAEEWDAKAAAADVTSFNASEAMADTGLAGVSSSTVSTVTKVSSSSSSSSR